MIAFGPVPSRRLKQSLGINHIPPKHCTYDCVYCQVGPTPKQEWQRREFYAVEEVKNAVTSKVKEAEAAGTPIDYLTFVPDGEPGLDIHLGEMIRSLRPLGYPIAVISNSSLITDAGVRADLAEADWVSLKVDAVNLQAWQGINRPHPDLRLSHILEGIREFALDYKGVLTTETMLVKGVNDGLHDLQACASFLEVISPQTAYIGVPTRPPSEKWAQTPDEATVLQAFDVFSHHLPRVELLLGYPEAPMQVAGDPRENLLDITSVHPMQEEEVLEVLSQAGADRYLLDQLLKEGELVRVPHKEKVFYVRRMPHSK